MDFVAKLLHGLSVLPAVVNGIQGVFGGRPGEEKRAAAMAFIEATLSIGEALANRQITDGAKFKEGLGKMIDGAVECLNASAWAQQAAGAEKA